MIHIKSQREIKLIRESALIVAEVLDAIEYAIRPGVSSYELNQLAERIIKKAKAKAAFKGYRISDLPPYPYAICASINNIVVHGYSTKNRILKDGDIIGIDVGVYKNGYYGDAARTYAVGKVSKQALRLMEVTKSALYNGIAKAIVGNRVGDISYAIMETAHKNNMSVADNLTGHGVGKKLHEDPMIPNIGEMGKGPRLKAGMTLAIEPMFNIGGPETIEHGWEFYTKDKSLSAHYEHTIVITNDGPQILSERVHNYG
ncbi:MAG: type I methionyl aminopeptidase [Candidatus Cloacimonadota bacterium]|nr:MAG: type I methionyl aminopeptidase [Candidatus Cloacimonadota bacterium]